jgi:hypothetical protein
MGWERYPEYGIGVIGSEIPMQTRGFSLKLPARADRTSIPAAHIKALFSAEKDDIVLENTCLRALRSIHPTSP